MRRGTGVDLTTADSVLSATAHELRLPLSHIKGFVSTLRRPDIDWDEDTKKEFLAQIERETDRLAELVDDLMDHSSARQRQTRDIQRVPTAPAALVAGGLDRVRGLLDGRAVDVDVSPDLPMVDVDAPAIERVIANLLDNAVKYTPGDSQIGLCARVSDGVFELLVEDEGPGISASAREQIFERFFRGPEAQSSGLPGTGLGLAICLSIVSAHGGRIWAEARPHGGTRFTVALPQTADSTPLTLDAHAARINHHHPKGATDTQRESRACRGPGSPNRRAARRPYLRS
jgi:two-component system, OmpR family, sensor histidine kinase KdpD